MQLPLQPGLEKDCPLKMNGKQLQELLIVMYFPGETTGKKTLVINIEESSIGDTTPVDKYIELANDFGIVDTIGNVVEWTSDTSELPSYIKNRSKFYIIKGGSWISGNDIRLFSSFKLEPESHSNILGFRCVAY